MNENEEYALAFKLWLDGMKIEQKECRFIMEEYSNLIHIKAKELELCNKRINRAINNYNEWASGNNKEAINNEEDN